MDPSQASINANQREQQPKQIENIICMDLKYYKAAAEGDIEVFKKNANHQFLHLLLTPIKNTVLHIYITTLNYESKPTTPNVGSELKTTTNAGLESTTTLNAGSESTINFVEGILEMCPSLLWKANAKDETPLHIAARYNHGDIVKILIKSCAKTDHHQDLEDGIEPVKKMLRMTNKLGDTALHEAVRYDHREVVELLIKEDPNYSYFANDAQETLLYIAAERGLKDMVIKILDSCNSPRYVGPLGRTALHAAVIRGDDYKDMTSEILEKVEAAISIEVDINGWTPLHLAAYFNHSNLAKLLLEKDRKAAYIKDTKGRTALHIAAQRGHYDAISESIVSKCPDCCELVDNKGWNVLHFAFKRGGRGYLTKYIIENPSLSNLLNEKNADGDTPLHFYSSSLESEKTFISHPRVDKMAFNNQNLSAYDVVSTNAKLARKKKLQIMKAINPKTQRVITYEDGDKDKKNEDNISMLQKAAEAHLEVDEDKKEDERSVLQKAAEPLLEVDKEKTKEDETSVLQKAAEALLKVIEEKKEEDERSVWQKAAEAHLVVAALITTVTFAACITMPGGFAGGGADSRPGSALLRRSAAFKAFVITDTISMVLSSSAVFIHLFMPFLFDGDEEEEKREKIFVLAFKFILGAMVAMGLAFVTGTYAVLVPSWDIAILNFIIGLSFFVSLLLGFLKISENSFFELLNDIIDSIKRRI